MITHDNLFHYSKLISEFKIAQNTTSAFIIEENNLNVFADYIRR